MKRSFKLSLIIILSLSLMGLRSIDFKSYTDPDFEGYKAESFVVCFGSTTMILEAGFINSLKKQKGLKNIKWLPCDDLYPPTREWTSDTRASHALKKGYKTLLGVGIEFSAKSAPAYSSGFDSPLYSQSEYELTLFDFETNKKAWVAKVGISNKGAAFAGNAKGDGKALATRTIKELIKDGHL